MPPTVTLHLRHPVTDLTLTVSAGRRAPVVTGIRFGLYGKPGGASGREGQRARKYRDDLRRFLDGRLKTLDHIPLALDSVTPFRRSVLLAARRIRWGRTVSYEQLARMAGHPGATRAAASAMRNNPFPLIVPCHRVVRKDGSLGGFMGKTTGAAVELKRVLLDREA